MKMEIKRLVEWAVIPEFKTPGAAAADLYVADGGRVPLHGFLTVHTGVAIHINNPSVVGLVFLRSSAGNRGLFLANGTGVIDSDYQGEILLRVGRRLDSGCIEHLFIEQGERIAQIVFVPKFNVTFTEVGEFTNGTTIRGEGGFGSTGLR